MTIEGLTSEVKSLNTKFIVVTGGVCSSIGKGVLIASIGTLLKNAGYSVNVIKCDPYLNVDPGTMSPLVHGEVFVTQDGAETDLDLGHYERILGVHLNRSSSITSGQVFNELINGERKGSYLGGCIQLVPHAVDAIKARLLTFALTTKVDFVLVEIGGTVGDMEGEIYLEAIRQLKQSLERHVMLCHLSYVPYLEWANEVKTKPTQHSIMLLKKSGLAPDALFLRTERVIDSATLKKTALLGGVDANSIFQVQTYKPVYRLFSDLCEQGVGNRVQEWFKINTVKPSSLRAWSELVELIQADNETIRIGLVAKYVGSNDPYISVIEAIKAAGYAVKRHVDLVLIPSEKLEENDAATWELLKSVDGVVVPGGFGKRGIEGKIKAATWARENKKPYLGLCLGMQIMLIEAARSLLHLSDANSTEFDTTTAHPVISLLDEQQAIDTKGASMRLGTYLCNLKAGSKACQAYGAPQVAERHRHRYEFNNDYRTQMEKAGVLFSGIYEAKNLVEIAEIVDHPFMVATQFHPEFTSSPLNSHPLFKAFAAAVVAQKGSK